ncbi:MAG: DNA primase [halophilic archaeon J07HX64]|jgi:DNA primase (EC 2.7.7.-)|nr:MAG: DNA primase [halophilic archaeon J07HX64]
MQHSAKYIIHAEIQTSGVVERSDVVGAVFGQTEGLLGEELDLRTLQESEKVGRIDVDIDSADGKSFGTFTISSGMDRVETAVLAASFETIERVGPCYADCRVIEIEDVRAAKRRNVVDRATELLQAFEERAVTGETLVEEVRKQTRAAGITQYAGLPAGPNVETSDAIIIVEGRADVRQLLGHGVKNVIAAEGTDVPDAVTQLTRDRTTTAFLDGDRGGDLILEELTQVGSIDYVAFAADGKSVEDLEHAELRDALEKKIRYDQVTDGTTPREAFAPTEGGTVAPAESTEDGTVAPAESTDGGAVADSTTGSTGSTTGNEEPAADHTTAETDDGPDEREPQTLRGHVEAVVGRETGQVRLLDGDLSTLAETDAAGAFDAVVDSESSPHTVVLDGTITQRILDITAQRGVGQVVGAASGEFVKQPTSVRVRTADDLL